MQNNIIIIDRLNTWAEIIQETNKNKNIMIRWMNKNRVNKVVCSGKKVTFELYEDSIMIDIYYNKKVISALRIPCSDFVDCTFNNNDIITIITQL